MDGKTAYSPRAEKYAKYRWDYAPEAIDTIFDNTRISRTSTIADIGSGTGILSRHFLGRTKLVFAVEPNPDMRLIAEKSFSRDPSFHSVAGSAEATTLPDHSIDLITVAQAIHWFDPEPTRWEFQRLIKDDGWLALLRNYPTDREIGRAMGGVFTTANGAVPPEQVKRPEGKPPRYFYGDDRFLKETFPFTQHQQWEGFLGAALSASFAPAEDHPRYPRFEKAVRNVFDQFSENDRIETHGATELHLGRMMVRDRDD